MSQFVFGFILGGEEIDNYSYDGNTGDMVFKRKSQR